MKLDVSYLPRLDLSMKECVDILNEKITTSVEKSILEAPIGVFLSGGLDSATIAFYASLFDSTKTFTIAFEEPTFGEQDKAQKVADLLGTDHHEVPFTMKDFVDTAFELIPKLIVPFGDSALIPAYYLSKVAKGYVDYVLVGDGGDELFVGYPTWRAYELLKYYKLIPEAIRRKILIPIINRIPLSHENENWRYRAKKFVEAEEWPCNPYCCWQVWWGAFNPHRQMNLFREDVYRTLPWAGHLLDNVDFYRRQTKLGETVTDRLMRQTQARYLSRDRMNRVILSTHTGLQIRSPFLNENLVRWINKVPFEYKYHRGKTKIILKELMKDKLPKDIVYQGKRGFTPPIAQWIAKSKRIKDVIFSKDDLFNIDYIQQLWDEHISRRQNHRKLLWTLFVYKLWQS